MLTVLCLGVDGLFEGGLLLEGEVVGSWDVLQSLL